MTNGSKFEPREQMNRALKPNIKPLANHTSMLMLSGFLLQILYQFA